MSLSDFQHPLYVVRHPQPEPEVKQALLSRWASEDRKARDCSTWGRQKGAGPAFPWDDVARKSWEPRRWERGQ